jgi:hypothetical protein
MERYRVKLYAIVKRLTAISSSSHPLGCLALILAGHELGCGGRTDREIRSGPTITTPYLQKLNPAIQAQVFHVTETGGLSTFTVSIVHPCSDLTR